LRLLANFDEAPVPSTGGVELDSMIYCSGPVAPDTEIAPACAAFFLLAAAAGR
jgi:hypothetical protein